MPVISITANIIIFLLTNIALTNIYLLKIFILYKLYLKNSCECRNFFK